MAIKELNPDKYSNKRSYDGQPVPAGQVLVPIWIKKGFQNDTDICVPDNFITWKFAGVHFLIGFAPIDRDAFGSYMKFFWSENNEYLEQKRTGRCVIGRNADGTPLVCPKAHRCVGCPDRGTLPRYNPKSDEVELLSLDFCYEDETFDVADYSQPTPEEVVLMDELYVSLLEHLRKIKPRYATIAKLSREGFSREEIITRIGLKPSRGYQEIENTYQLTLKYLRLKK